jgi:isopentenyldiphosphate isomerase
MRVQQNDPSELLEILDADGRATGQARSRAAIHLNGDWHKAFHCWIVRAGGHQVVLQRRSLGKDTYAGCWDAAAAGHWRFGESPEEAAREIWEELGLEVPFASLLYRGRERAEREFDNGLVDREFHEVYVLESGLPLSAYRPDPREVIGLAAFATDALLADTTILHALEAVTVSADGSLSPTSVAAGRDELVPYPAERLRRMLGRS